MKMTEFEVGKKYFRDCMLVGWHYCFDEIKTFTLYDDHGLEQLDLQLQYDDIKADDWQEYKEPVNYGTENDTKLMLVKDYAFGKRVWIEGYQNPSHESCINVCEHNGQSEITKDRILKVIDLPSKEL